MSGRNSLGNAIPLSLRSKDLWGSLLQASAGGKAGFFKITLPSGGPLYIVNMHQSIKMIPFVRTKEELFETTAKRESTLNKFKVVINGPTYDLTKSGYLDAAMGSDSVPAEDTIQQGLIVQNKKIIGGNKSNMYFVANYLNEHNKFNYKFGKGSAPTNADAAIGNMGPLVINRLPFGQVNQYDPLQPAAKRKGQPNAKYQKYLTQRSNARFSAMSNQQDAVGKIAIGYRFDKKQLLIMVQPHASKGVSISGLRGLAISLGLDSAVYLDGSDSVMLMLDNNILISQGSNKNETNVTGIGFVY